MPIPFGHFEHRMQKFTLNSPAVAGANNEPATIDLKLPLRGEQKEMVSRGLQGFSFRFILENQLQPVLQLPWRTFRVDTGAGTDPVILFGDFPRSTVWTTRRAIEIRANYTGSIDPSPVL